MGFLSAISSVRNSARTAYRALKFGKQIGTTSKSGVVCYQKNSKGMTTYTTLNKSTGQVVRTKKVTNVTDKPVTRSHDTFTYDAKGDLVNHTSYLAERRGGGYASNNSKAFIVRIHSDNYNQFGQVVDSRGIDFVPHSFKPTAFVHSHINGNEFGMRFNTVTGVHGPTYQCIE